MRHYMAALGLLLAAMAVAGAAAEESLLPPLPLFPALPGPCGRVEQVRAGDSCGLLA